MLYFIFRVQYANANALLSKIKAQHICVDASDNQLKVKQ